MTHLSPLKNISFPNRKSRAHAGALFAILLTAGSLTSQGALVAHWKLDDGSGSTAVDSAGANNNGTLNNGPTWVSGTVGGGLDFDGTNQSVNAPLTTIPTGSAARTISVWFNADTITKTDMKIFGYGDGSGTTGTGGSDADPFGDAFAFTVEDNGRVYLRYSGGNNRYNLAGNTNLSVNAWYHLAAVVPDGATGTDDVLVYLNGSLANTTLTGTVRPLFTDPTPTVPDFYLGHDGGGGAYFDGTLDDVQIYDTALSATEIASLFSSPGSVIPEPSAASLIGLLGGACLLRRRRRSA